MSMSQSPADDFREVLPGFAAPPGIESSGRQRPLHRIRTVRRRQGVSMRRAAHNLGLRIDEARRQEDPQRDLLLSQVYAWQRVLQAPLNELLVDADEPLSAPVLKRARMIRLMKTVGAILARCDDPSVRTMAQTLVEQLVEMMPELEGVTPWHAIGERRTSEEYGRTAYQVYSTRLIE